jgi:ABC-2 type transport system permease protein
MPEITLGPAPVPAPALRRRSRTADAMTMIGRCVRLTRRDAESFIMALALPIMLMLLFVYLFGGAINTGTAYITYVVPGVLLVCVGFGASSTTVSVCKDASSGVADRFRAMDVSGAAMVGGQVAASLARNAVATTHVMLVALLIGFRPRADAWQWLGAAAILGLFVLAESWVSAAVGVAVRSTDAAGGFGFFLSFLAYPSSAFVPIDTMPSWLQGFARNQPVTHVVEALRGLLLDRPAGSHPAWAIGWSLALTGLAMAAASLLTSRRRR